MWREGRGVLSLRVKSPGWYEGCEGVLNKHQSIARESLQFLEIRYLQPEKSPAFNLSELLNSSDTEKGAQNQEVNSVDRVDTFCRQHKTDKAWMVYTSKEDSEKTVGNYCDRNDV
jgi:hypothetical protein